FPPAAGPCWFAAARRAPLAYLGTARSGAGTVSSRSGRPSQTRTVPSMEALARRRLSGAQLTLQTLLVCPLSEMAPFPVGASRTFTAPSQEAPARRGPSGPQLTLPT